MKKFYFLLLATLTMCIYSCTQEEPVFEHCSEQISLNETEIENLYCLYSTDAVKDFSEKFKNLLPSNSRSEEVIETPASFGLYLSSLSEDELVMMRDSLASLSTGQAYDADYGIDLLIDSTNIYEATKYLAFRDEYIISNDKKELLLSSVKDKPLQLQKLYVQTAAATDYVAIPIVENYIKPETIFVGGNGYYGDCEHQFVMDMAKACAEDVLVEFWGGGPEDVAADVTCGIGDAVEIIGAAISYVDCKKGKKYIK